MKSDLQWKKVRQKRGRGAIKSSAHLLTSTPGALPPLVGKCLYPDDTSGFVHELSRVRRQARGASNSTNSGSRASIR